MSDLEANRRICREVSVAVIANRKLQLIDARYARSDGRYGKLMMLQSCFQG